MMWIWSVEEKQLLYAIQPLRPHSLSAHTLTIHLLHFITIKSNKTQQPTRTKHLPKGQPLQRKQLLHAIFDRYVLIRPTIRSRDPFSTLNTNDNQRNAAADAYGAPPPKRDLLDENIYYEPHSIALS